jgi:hypothetical protein
MAQTAQKDQPTQAERTGRKPEILYDNGHGMQVKQWPDSGKDGKYTNTVIERGYKTDDGFKTEKVSLNQDELLAIARSLEKGHDKIVDKRVSP